MTQCFCYAARRMQRILLITLLAISLLLSLPSLWRSPRFVPFLRSEVRAAAPRMMEQLRSQGLWLVNVELLAAEERGEKLCFLWQHQYHARTHIDAPEELLTCIP